MKPKLFPAILIAILFSFNSFAQQPVDCGLPSPPGEDNCEDACVYCDLTANGYMGSTIGYTPDPPSNYCGTIENNQWFAFAAGTTTVEFTIIASNCSNGDGVQGAIYPGCDPNAPPIACEGGQNNGANNPIVVTATNLVVGQIYWFMVDGWLGDECDYDVTVTQGNTDPPPLDPPGPIIAPPVGCAGQTVTFEVPALPGASYYEWVLPDGSIVTTDVPYVDYTFGQGGQVCVTANNVCNFSDQVCLSIDVLAPDAGILTINPNPLCPNETANITVSGYNAGLEYTQNILIADAGGNIITIINGDAGTFTHDACDNFQVCTYNYVTSEGPVPMIGDNVNNIDCNGECCDINCLNLSFEDLEAPMFPNGPGDLTLTCADLVPPLTDLEWTDNCDGTGMVSGLESGSADLCSGGSIQRIWEYTDACGNTGTHTQSINIDPSPPPAFINPPASQTVECDNIPTGAPDLNYTNNGQGGCLIEGAVPPVESGSADICGGTITYTWDYTDLCGNNINHVQNITVNPAPVPAFINPPADVTLSCDNIPLSGPDLDYTNNGSGVCLIEGTLSPVESGSADICGGTITYTWEFTDACSNTISHTQNVTIEPATPPTFINPPSDITLSCENIPTSAPDLDYTNNGIGACLIEGTITPTQEGSADICGSTVIYRWQFTDQCGNIITHIQSIEITPAPVPAFINPPADITLNCDNIPTSGPDLDYTNNASGVCLIAGTESPVESGSADICGGTIAYNWEFTDQCGNTITHTQNVTIDPAPVPSFINPPADITLNCDNIPTSGPDLDYTNNGPGACLIEGTVSPVESGNGSICGGTITYTWEYTDICGNTITHVQNIEITPAPHVMFLNPPGDQTVSCDNVPGNPGNLDYTNNGPGACLIEGTVSPVQSGSYDECGGTITYTWEFTDPCGNTITHVQNINIDPAPQAQFIGSLPQDITVNCGNIPPLPGPLDYSNNESGACLIEGSQPATQSGSFDECGGTVVFTWQFTDNCNRTITHTQSVTVEPAPEATFTSLPGPMTLNCSEVPPIPPPLNYTNNQTGVCEISGTVDAIQSGSYNSCGGTITYTWVFTDDCNRTISHSQSVTVNPASDPYFTTLPPDITINCGEPPPTPMELPYTNDETGPCAIVGTVPATITIIDDLTWQYFWTYTNPCNNATITHTQIVTENPAPEINITPNQAVICEGDFFDLTTITVTDQNNTNLIITYHSGSPASPGNQLPSPNVNPLQTTVYFILATNEFGCTDEEFFTLEVESPPFAGIDGSGHVCYNLSTNVNLFDFLNGDPVQTGQWLDNNNYGFDLSNPYGVDFSGFPPGFYMIDYVVSSNGVCPDDVATVTVELLPDIELDIISIECTGNDDFYEILLNSYGYVVIPDAGIVNDLGGNQILISDIPIDHTTLIYAFNALHPECLSFVTVNPPNCDCPTVDPPVNNGDATVCEGEPNPELSVTVGANETANWYDNPVGGNLLLAGSTTYTPDETAVGTYTYYVEAENLLDSCLSSILTPIQFQIFENPTGNDAQLFECDNDGDGFALFDLTAAEDSISQEITYTFEYYESLEDAENGNNPLPTDYTNTSTPSQEIFVVITNSVNCTHIVSLTLSLDEVPSINLDITDESCLGDGDGSVDVNAPEGVLFSLDSITWTAETLFDSLAEGAYTIFVEGNNGCINSEDFDIGPGLEIELTSFEINCDDNGTASDATDDFYTITFTVDNSLNNPGTYTINDGTNDLGTFNYGNQETITIDALGQTLDLTFSDDNIGCPIIQSIGPLNSCSTDCTITINQLGFECSDEGTPSDPSDDIYTISINTSAINGSSNNTYNVLIDGNLTYNFDYDMTSTFNLPADGSSPIITVVDNEDDQCQASQSIGPLDPCSGQCIIDFADLTTFCNDNGTVSNQDDDFYEVTIDATAINGSPTNNFIVFVDGVQEAIFAYGTGGTIIIPADGSSPTIMIVDETDSNCTAEQQIGPLDPCTDECTITASISNIECDNQGTENDPSDDTYTFDLLVTGQNVSSGWETDDGSYSGNYGDILSLGPFLISDGNQVLIILDNGNPACTTQVTATAPPPCSDPCEINFTLLDVVCNDNGTVTIPGDDFYEITINATAVNAGATNNFIVFVDGIETELYEYGIGGTFTLPADGSSPIISIVDETETYCSNEQLIGPLAPCTDECLINGSITNIECNNEGTEDDSSDDTYTFDLLITGQNTSSSWVSDNGSYNGDYGVTQQLGPFLISNGDVTLTIQDAQNQDCNVELTANAPPPCSDCPQTADAGQGGTLTCDEETITLTASTSEPGNYLWTGPNSFEETTLTVLVNMPGTYYFTATYLGNCVAEDSVIVEIADNVPIVNAGPDQIITCDIDQVYLDGSMSSQGSNILYFWTNENGDTISQEIGVTVSAGGTYYLQLTDTVSGCVSAIDPANVIDSTTLPIAIIYAEPQNILDCTVSSILLYSIDQDNVEYTWSSSSNTVTAPQIIVGEPDTYTLLAIDTITGCENSDFIIIEDLQDYPFVNINPADTLSCYFPEILINASGSQTGPDIVYNWYDGLYDLIVGENGDSLLVTEGGFYYLQLIDTTNGCQNTDSVYVESLLDQIPMASIDQIGALDCNNLSLILDGSGSIPFNNLTFEWSTSNGNIISGENTPNPEIDQGGTYTLLVTDVFSGCTHSESVDVIEDMETPVIVILTPDMVNCYNPEIEIDASNSSTIGNLNYFWTSDPPGGIVTGGNTLNPTIIQGGTFILTITNLDNGCTESGSVEVSEDTELPLANASVNDELDCITEEVIISGLGSSTGSEFSYIWTGPGIISGNTTLLPIVNQPGIYIITVFNAQNGCLNTDEVPVNENTNVPAGLDAVVTPPVCFGDRGSVEVVSVDGGEGPYLYSIDDGVTFNTFGIFTSLEPGDYTILIQDANGCEYEDYFFLPSVPELLVNLESEIIVQLGESTQLIAIINIPISLIDTIVWSPIEGLSCTNCLDPIVTPLNETLYTVTVTNLDGCTASDQIMLRVRKDRDIYIPNAFSPHNNDGINDVFMIFGNEKIVAKINTFQVFDRWGELVWEYYDFSPNDTAHGWDGKLKGQPMNPAVFAYWAEIEFIDGVKKLYKGDVTLLR